jgi:nitrogen regulatory protein PII
MVRIDLVVAPARRNDEVIAAIQTTARTGQAGEDKILVSPIERAVSFAMERLRKQLGTP